MAIYWLIAAGVLILIEMITLGLTTIWFAGGSFVGFLAAVLGADLWLQILLCLLVSIILLVFTRPIAEKHLNHSRVKTNVDELVGKTGKVIEEIDNSLSFSFSFDINISLFAILFLIFFIFIL